MLDFALIQAHDSNIESANEPDKIMSRLTTELKDLIVERVGRFNVDVLSGWEEGIKGKQRIAGRLFDRYAPDHLNGQRYHDWNVGYRAGLMHRAHEAAWRETVFYGTTPNGELVVRRKGWVARASVVSQMARKGAYGDVTVFYWERSKIVRTVNCGI